jgi:hypothetical protein
MTHPNPAPADPTADMNAATTTGGHEPEPTPGKCNGRLRDKSRRGALCRLPSGHGTNHVGTGRCARHGGNTPSHKAAAAKVVARRAVETYGLPIKMDPRDAVLAELYRTLGAVAFIEGQIRALDPEQLIWGKTEEVDTQATEYPGTNTKHAAVPNAWLELFKWERRHSLEVSKTAHAIGVEEYRIRMVEQMGGQLAAVIRAFIARLGLTPEQLALTPGALAAAVAEISGTTNPRTIEGAAA